MKYLYIETHHLLPGFYDPKTVPMEDQGSLDDLLEELGFEPLMDRLWIRNA